jgi:hypothetical protein
MVIGNKTPRHKTVHTKLHSRIHNVACKPVRDARCETGKAV